MTKLDELQKAIEDVAEAGTGMLRKSQMSLDFSAPNPHVAENEKAAAYHRGKEETYRKLGHHADADQHAKQALKHENMASSLANNPHHVAYTRTNASGTVSQIQQKGVPKWNYPENSAYGDKRWKAEKMEKLGKPEEAAHLHDDAASLSDQMGMPEIAAAHRKERDRLYNASGTVSNVQAKGVTKQKMMEAWQNKTQDMTKEEESARDTRMAARYTDKANAASVEAYKATDKQASAKHIEAKTLHGVAAGLYRDAGNQEQATHHDNKAQEHLMAAAGGHKVGDTVHMGFGTKGGAGVVGKITPEGSNDMDVDGITPAKARLYKTATIKDTGEIVKVEAAGHMTHNPETNRMEHVFRVVGSDGYYGKLPQSVMHNYVL